MTIRTQLQNENVSSEQMSQIVQERLSFLERAVTQLGLKAKSLRRPKLRTRKQASVLYGLSRAIVVETIDPWKQNRVRFFHPVLHKPNKPVLSLPFASPVSAMGGFDDCGLNWVPPAGSTIVIFYENGIRHAPFYIGTTWHRYRGPGGSILPVDDMLGREWAIHKGHRKGYFHGPGGDPNDESQVLPPWNTESYNSKDTDDFNRFIKDPCEHHQATFPHIYGFKTPQKHMLKLHDGDPKCNRRWKRLEMLSSGGNWMMFKDDHMHYGGHWAYSSTNKTFACSTHNSNFSYFTDLVGKPVENPSCSKNGKCGNAGCTQCAQASLLRSSCSSQVLQTGGTIVKESYEFNGSRTPGFPPDPPTSKYQKKDVGQNPNFKHMNEQRPYDGPGTPQNNKCALPQTGIQFLSISGHTIVMDDSVEEPRGVPEWERSLKPFDFGCNDKYLGMLWMKSATGHSFVMSDVEKESKVRGEQNMIELRSGNGNRIQLNDHTVKNVGQSDNCAQEGQTCPPDHAGEHRGIHLISTSNHKIKMIDNMNMQCGPIRKEGGTPTSKATKAYIQIQSGYGLEMRFNDDFSQEETQSQWIQILHPQCVDPNTDKACQSCDSNECRGPHIMRFQGRPRGTPGVIYLRAGGHSIRQTYDMDIVLVGDKEKNPSDKFTYVSKKHFRATEDIDFRYSGEMHILFAEKQILLMAGRDCPPKEGKKCCGPCLYNVIIARCPVMCPITGILHFTEKAMSERVFASGWRGCNPPKPCPPDGQTVDCCQKGCQDDVENLDIDTGTGIVTVKGQTTNQDTNAEDIQIQAP